MKKIFDDIYVGSNIISKLNDYTKDFDKILIFSNETIADLYFEKFKSTLNEKDKVFYFAIKDGEEYKNIESILPVYDFMLENNFSRKSLVISLGGGVICDMGGYISATYMRGIEFIQVPTSLLAQVDASVGGKVAINHPKCKNMIGSFKNPYRVIIDVEFLKTLPKREFKSGMGELLKHSFLTKDKSYLEYIENNVEKIKNLDSDVLENIVEQSIRIKKHYVDIDPFEKGERAFLNLGHTYAHALESFFDYKAYTHGEAVSKGIIFDLELSFLRGEIDKEYLERARNIFKLFDIDTDLIYLPSDKFIPLMRKDKKNSFNKIITILIDSEGHLSKTEVQEDEITKIIDKYKNSFLRASIDIGTNSCRLLIAEVQKNNEIISFKKEIYKDLEIVKLGEDVNINKFLKEEAIERALNCLKKYREVIDKYSIEEKNIICFATSATRDSTNRDYFIKKVYDETKIKINCISGDKEAYINFKGVISSFDRDFKDNILVFDIGGGSTEFTLGNMQGIEKKISLNIGSVRITEKFFLNNKIYNYSEENRVKAKEWVKENLKELEDFKREDFTLIGVAGTTTTQVSVKEKMEVYDSEKIHLSNLTSKEINDNLNLFIKYMNNEEIKGLDPKRKDVIIGGTIILKEILGYFDDDMVNIIYKDLKLNGLSDEEVENLLKEKHRDLPMIEINVFQLNNYKLGSIGFTSRELENLKIDFIEEKLLSNDYNGDNPTNKIVYLKVLFDKESKKILGCQIANERNIESRLNAIKNTIEKGGDLKDLVKYKVNPTDNEWNPDILNILALTALGKNQENSDDVEANNIENLVKNKEFLLDVREEYEYQEGHVKGAVNLPLRKILEKKDSLPKDKDIYVYCRSGHRSADAVNVVTNYNFD